MRPRAILIGRILISLAALLALVAAVAWYTGGAGTNIAGLRISVHNSTRPLIYAAICALATLLLCLWTGGSAALLREIQWWGSLSRQIPSAWRAVTRGRFSPLAVITAIAIVLDCLQWWRGAPLWLDEQMIAINIRDRSYSELRGTLWLGQTAPLGWLWLERTIMLIAGHGERTLRVIPLAFGIGTLVAAFWIARRWLRPWAGLVLIVLCWLGSVVSDYRFEMKHYSADCFWALLLPALAVWTTLPDGANDRARRQMVWAFTAGIAQWTSYAALFVAPGCLLWLLAVQLQSRSSRSYLSRYVAAGSIWFVLFAAHYAWSIRFTHQNTFLRRYWDDRLPPVSEDILGRLAWIGQQLPSLGTEAGGTRFPLLLFVVGIGGMLIARDRRLGTAYVTVPLAAAVLAMLRLVPVFERFSLWVIPTLYLGIALALDRSATWGRPVQRARRHLSTTAAILIAATALPLAVDIVVRGWARLDITGRADTNRGMDDRRGVAWLMQQRQPGDAIISTRLGWPAIWWYGDISLADHPDGRLDDGSRMYQVSFGADRQRCGRLRELLMQHRRALVYVSFPDEQKSVIARLDHDVMPLVTLAGRREVTTETRGVVLRVDSDSRGGDAGLAGGVAPDLNGCLELPPAVRW